MPSICGCPNPEPWPQFGMLAPMVPEIASAERTARAVFAAPTDRVGVPALPNCQSSFGSFASSSDRAQALVCCGCFGTFAQGSMHLHLFDRRCINRLLHRAFPHFDLIARFGQPTQLFPSGKPSKSAGVVAQRRSMEDFPCAALFVGCLYECIVAPGG